jgi:hypothetical protein
VDQNRYLHARRDFCGRLILFAEVDCAAAVGQFGKKPGEQPV